MTVALTAYRRSILIAVSITLSIAFILYSTPILDTNRLKIISGLVPSSSTTTPTSDPLPTKSASLQDLEIVSPKAQPKPTPAPQPGTAIEETSKLHFLIPASQPNLRFCYNVASGAVNQYPPPHFLGWNATGLYNAAQTHLAKLRAIQRYLNKLDTTEDKNLVLIVDGYDVIMQLPPEIMIARYFDVVKRQDAHLAERFGMSVEEAHNNGLRNTILFGADKICWPIDPNAARCWAAPPSYLPDQAFGLKENEEDLAHIDPRWLNSGTMIGPVDHVRTYITAIMNEIDMTYDPGYEFRESDQFYLANVWGRQEYWRSNKRDVGADNNVPGEAGKEIPHKLTKKQETEFHVGIEYESALFQTKAANEPFYSFREFAELGLELIMDVDIFSQPESFKPYNIKMPNDTRAALTRLYSAIPQAETEGVPNEWLSRIAMGVNYVTNSIFALWHCTGGKEEIDAQYQRFWFYPYVKSLLKAAVKSGQAREPISQQLIDGRRWYAADPYPDQEALKDELGGGWSDFDEGEFVPWEVLCGEHAELLFSGEIKGAEVTPEKSNLTQDQVTEPTSQDTHVNEENSQAKEPAPEDEESEPQIQEASSADAPVKEEGKPGPESTPQPVQPFHRS